MKQKKQKNANNGRQNTTKKRNDCATKTVQKQQQECERRYYGRVSSSFSTNGTRLRILVINLMLHQGMQHT